ncbi:MAG: DUF2922 family protein [Culicoidibacterales bacterium]
MQQTTTKSLELRFQAPISGKKYNITISNPAIVEKPVLEQVLTNIVASGAIKVSGEAIIALDARYITKVVDGFTN